MSIYDNRRSADQHARTNLDQDVHASRQDKFRRSEDEIKQYIFDTLSIPSSVIHSYTERNYDLLDILKDGEYLCKLGQLIPISNNPCTKYKSSKMPFVQMENISFFLSLCSGIGVPHDEIFQTVDLYEKKDPYQIIITLISFSRIANTMNPTDFPRCIGAKPVKVKPQVPKKPVKLRS